MDRLGFIEGCAVGREEGDEVGSDDGFTDMEGGPVGIVDKLGDIE